MLNTMAFFPLVYVTAFECRDGAADGMLQSADAIADAPEYAPT